GTLRVSVPGAYSVLSAVGAAARWRSSMTLGRASPQPRCQSAWTGVGANERRQLRRARTTWDLRQTIEPRLDTSTTRYEGQGINDGAERVLDDVERRLRSREVPDVRGRVETSGGICLGRL